MRTATDISREEVRTILDERNIVKLNRTIRNRTARKVVRRELTNTKDANKNDVVYGYDKEGNIRLVDSSIAETYILYKDTACKHTSTFFKDSDIIIACTGHINVNGVYIPRHISITDQKYRLATIDLTIEDGKITHQHAYFYIKNKLGMIIEDDSCRLISDDKSHSLVKQQDTITLQHVSGICYSRNSKNSELHFEDLINEIRGRAFDNNAKQIFESKLLQLQQEVGVSTCFELMNLFFERNIL